MNLDFLWQNLIWLVIGLAASWLYRQGRLRWRRTRLRRFLGRDVMSPAGVAVTVPVLHPLTKDDFAADTEKTMAFKSDDLGNEVRRPIYGDVLHLADYEASQEIFALLGHLGQKNTRLLSDAESLNAWSQNPCLVCLGSPFVNATMGDLLRMAEDNGQARISGTRLSDTLDSYRLQVNQPERLVLGVDPDHAIGVIARLPHPTQIGRDWVVGVWGDRTESTLGAAAFLRGHFDQVYRFLERKLPLIVVLAMRGVALSVPEVMYVATDRVVQRNDELLAVYSRPDVGPTVATVPRPPVDS